MTQVIKTVLDVDASKAVAGFRDGEKAVDGYSRAVDSAGSKANSGASGFAGLTTSIRNNRAAWDDLSSKAMIGGAAIVGGLGLATKAAIDWESAWAGVAKTVDGTPKQMADLEDGLRGLARELPATHEEIAGVAEAAGQLGVARKDILGFTETAIALGESTNLSAEEAATSLAKFSNIMGTTAREGVAGYEKLGSTLVALGNDGASTEADIMQMSLRLAGAGKQIGATEADIMAMANALSSVGIEAELGGGAMSRAMLKINSAVIGGGDELEKFAQISGMSAQEFATKWRSDPIAATNAFVGGLGRIGESGGDASAALDSVGLAGTQNAQVLLRAAGSSDLMTKSLKLGASAWEANAALQKEAAQRYKTDASRIQVSMNRIKDAGIGFGAAIAPALATGAEAVAGFADAIGKLPGPAKTAISGVAGVTGAALLLGGATVKAVGFAQDVGDAFSTISSRGPRAEAAIGGVGRSAKIAAGAFAVLAAASAAAEAIKGDYSLAVGPKELAQSSLEATDAVKVLNSALEENAVRNNEADSTTRTLEAALKSAFDPSVMDQFGNANATVWEKVTFGLADITSKADEAKDVFGQVDDMLSQMFQQGDSEGASRILDQYIKEANAAGVSTKDFMSKLPQTREAMAGMGGQAKKTGDDVGGMGDQAKTAEEQVEELSDAITGLGDTLLGQRGSARDYQAALDEMAASIKENGNTLDINTEAGRSNEAALDGLAESTQEWAASVIEAGGSASKAQGILDQGRQQWMNYALAMGMPKREAKALADELFKIPADVKTDVKANGAEEAKAKVVGLGTSIKNLDGKTVTVKEAGSDASQGRIRNLDGALLGLPGKKTVQVRELGTTAAGEMVVKFKGQVYSIPASRTAKIRESGSGIARAKVADLSGTIKLLNGKTVKVGERGAQNATGKVRFLNGSIFGLKGKTVRVEEIGSTASGDRVYRFRGKIYTLKGKTVPVKESGASESMGRVQGLIDKIYGVNSKNADVRANVHGLWDVQGMIGAIAGVQSKTVTVTTIAKKVNSWFADGGSYEGGAAFADGGVASFRGQQPQIRRAGGAGVTWAEDGAGPWESFISGHPAKAARSKAIWMETGKRLGMIEAHADGAMRHRLADGGTLQRAMAPPPRRHYVAPPPRVSVQAPQPQQPVQVGASAAQIEAAITRAFTGVRITTNINGRDFAGVMQRTTNDRKGR